ncbi:MAG: PDZ domain-containing protein [Planctomycetes bacterium]|nr:PDZ domain-containing protein [Planctomycetota bacterium]
MPEHSQTEEQFNSAECFDKVWEIINNEFWDPNFNGVDWGNARKRYGPKALAAKNHESFAVIINQMLAELKTSHTYYYTKWDPLYYTLQAALISGDLRENNTTDTSVLEKHLPRLYSSHANPHRVGIGVVTKQLNGRHFVTAVLTSSPAERAGIVLGDWIVEVNGRPFHPIRSFENEQGHELEVTIQRSSSVSSRHKLKVTPVDRKERELFENDTLAHSKKRMSHKGHRFSYIRLWWLLGWKMRGAFEVGLMDYDTEGIIIDIRDGFGGSPATEYIHPFLKSGLETITLKSISRKRADQYTMAYNIPVIVLINSGSRSGKELLAYYFKKTKRGLLIGERTAGYVSGGSYKRISEESMLLYCASMIVVDGKRLEGVGVEPDIEVPFDICLAGGKDIQLERAKDEMVILIDEGGT